MVYMLTNIHELTLSGNFKSTELSDNPLESETLMPEHVLNLVSIRLIEIDATELVAVFLVGITCQITSLVMHQPYSPRSVYRTLRPIIEKLSSLSSLSISIPALKLRLIRFGHCSVSGHKFVHKDLVPSLPRTN
jgi:hypothetical protein